MASIIDIIDAEDLVTSVLRSLNWFVQRQGQLGSIEQLKFNCNDQKVSFLDTIAALRNVIINEADASVKKAWCRRIAQDYVGWMRVTNPVAFN